MKTFEEHGRENVNCLEETVTRSPHFSRVSSQLLSSTSSATLSEMMFKETDFTIGQLIKIEVKFLWRLINIIIKCR